MTMEQRVEFLIEQAAELPEEAQVALMRSLVEMRGQALGINRRIPSLGQRLPRLVQGQADRPQGRLAPPARQRTGQGRQVQDRMDRRQPAHG